MPAEICHPENMILTFCSHSYIAPQYKEHTIKIKKRDENYNQILPENIANKLNY